MVLVLIGYMGSGKSTVGKELASVLNYTFLDLDDYIVEQEKQSISSIFKTKGEIYFRKIETQYLKEILRSKDNLVLALGGGTPCYGANMSLISKSENVISYYLKISIPILTNRLLKESQKRPLICHLQTEEELTEFIGKHLFERSQYYNQATHTISADDKTVKDIIERILMQLI